MRRSGGALDCDSEHGTVAHELRKIPVDDAVALLDGIVAREDVLRIVVSNLFQRRVFSVFGSAVAHHGHARLHVGVSGFSLAENEIAFKRAYSPDACRIAVGTGVGVDHIFKCRPVVDSVVGICGEVEAIADLPRNGKLRGVFYLKNLKIPL